jgi:spermidine synthase
MKAIIFLCFLLSGVSGLIFQVVWIRMLGLVFGTSSFAITTVLTSFMSGLALGSFITGRLSDSKKYNYLRGYGILEILVGIYGYFTPHLIAWLMGWYADLYQQFSPNFYLFSLIRFGILFLVLLPPTALMGSTLPLLCKFLTSQQDKAIGLKIGALYSINTFGAVVGTAIAGFALIPHLGVSYTLYTASLISGSAGLLSLLLSFKVDPFSWQPAETASSVAKVPTDPSLEESSVLFSTQISTSQISPREIRFMLAAFALSGGVALSYEIGWSRVLVLILGGAVYSFTTMLATFLLGLALGAMVMARFLDRWCHRGKEIFYVLQLLIGLSAFATMHLFNALPELYLNWVYLFNNNFWLFNLMKCALAACVMFLPTFFLGMIFPLVARLYSLRSDIGSSVGDVYSINTLGSIVGSFLMGFVLIPALGVSQSLFLCVLLNLFLACLGALFLKQATLQAGMILVLLSLLSAYRPQWDVSQMTSGVFRYAPDILEQRKAKAEERRYLRHTMDIKVIEYLPPAIAFYEDGLTATVSVHEDKEQKVLRINGKPEASSKGDLPTQILVAHLPYLFYPSETFDETMVIGLASGISTGSALTYPHQNLTCLELEGSTLEAAKLFADSNRHLINPLYPKEPLSSYPHFTLKTIDARNYLLGTSKTFSIIIAQPSNPWLSGVSNLFTKEYFQLCKKRLKPDGILCQWMQLYEISWESFQVVLSTLRSEFPHLKIFISSTQVDSIILASQQELPFNWEQIQKRMAIPEVQADLARIGIRHPAHFMSGFLVDSASAEKLFQSDFYNTDDNAYIEFAAPKQLHIASQELQHVFKQLQSTDQRLLESYWEQIPESERFSYLLEYIQTFLSQHQYKRLLKDASFIENALQGEERGILCAWLAIATLQAKQDPSTLFQKMDENAPEYLQGQVWKLHWEYEKSQDPSAILKSLTLDTPSAKALASILYSQQNADEEALAHAKLAYPDRKSWLVDEQVRFLNAYGRTLIRTHKYSEAVTVLEESHKLFWQTYKEDGYLRFDNIFSDLAKAYFELKQIDQAGYNLIRAFSFQQKLSVYYFKKGETSENPTEKEEYYAKASTLDPTFYQASFAYWKLLLHSNPSQAEELAKTLQKRFAWFEEDRNR